MWKGMGSRDEKMKDMVMNIIAVPRLLDLIGTSMYSDYCKAIGELVINGYDADAQKALVEVRDNKIVISDDGSGMSPAELQGSFLKFGGAQKQEVKKTPLYKREPVGNKGIGKWAGLGIAKKMIVLTEKEGTRSRITIDYDELIRHKDIKDIEIRGTAEKCNPVAHGTKVILTRLTTNNINVKRLLEYLSRELPMDGHIKYYVNGEEAKRTQIKADMRKPISTVLKHAGLVEGELIIATKRLDKIQPGIVVRVRGRQVGKPLLFGVPLNTSLAAYSHLITGEVNADNLNEYIKTDREGFKEDSDAYMEFYEFMDKSLLDFVKEKYRKAKMKKSIKEFEEKTEILQHIAKIFNKMQSIKQEISRGGKYYGIRKGGEEGFIKTDIPFTEAKEGENIKQRSNPIGITDKKTRKLVSIKPKIGRIIMGHKNYKVVISPNGIDDKECRIDDEICVITINEDHPSYIYAKKAENRPFLEYQIFKAISVAFSYKVSDNADKFYELLDNYMRLFVKESKKKYNLDISEFGEFA